VALVLPDVHWTTVLVTGALAALVGAGAFRVYLRPRLLVGPTGITVVNPMRTTEIAWAEIEVFTARFQLEVQRREAKTLQVWAVPGRGGLRLRETVTRAQIAADELNRLLGDEASRQPGPDPPLALAHSERVVLGAGAAIAAAATVV